MNRTLTYLLAILLSPFCLPEARARSFTTRPLVFTHVNVIAATEAPLQTNMTVVVAAGRISSVGKFGKTMLLAGTDEELPFRPSGFSHDELELLAQAGSTTMQQPATLNPAQFLNKAQNWGRLKKGK